MKKAYALYQQELAAIKEAGTYKDERIIVTPQKSRIDTTVAHGVVNMCANNYLGLSDNQELIDAAKASYDNGALVFPPSASSAARRASIRNWKAVLPAL